MRNEAPVTCVGENAFHLVGGIDYLHLRSDVAYAARRMTSITICHLSAAVNRQVIES